MKKAVRPSDALDKIFIKIHGELDLPDCKEDCYGTDERDLFDNVHKWFGEIRKFIANEQNEDCQKCLDEMKKIKEITIRKNNELALKDKRIAELEGGEDSKLASLEAAHELGIRHAKKQAERIAALEKECASWKFKYGNLANKFAELKAEVANPDIPLMSAWEKEDSMKEVLHLAYLQGRKEAIVEIEKWIKTEEFGEEIAKWVLVEKLASMKKEVGKDG
jgi:hypothetical protein